MNDLTKYELDKGVYYHSGLSGADRDGVIARVVFANQGCSLSYESVRKAMGLPAASKQAITGFAGMVNAITWDGGLVVLTDTPNVMSWYSFLIEGETTDLLSVEEIE